jgi:Arc/MetJ-type ribon-helix-helix transcriptional regulator
MARDHALEDWLHTDVGAAYDALKVDPSQALSADHARARLTTEQTNLPAIPVSSLDGADMQAIPAALARAAMRAREVAERSGTSLIVTKVGKALEEGEQSGEPHAFDHEGFKRRMQSTRD